MTRRFLPPALVLALLAGCAEPGKPPAAPAVMPAIVSHYERRLADGALAVAVNLKNSAAAAVTVRVGCQFVNAKGQALPEMIHWQTVTVAAGARETVQFSTGFFASHGTSADSVADATVGASAVAADERNAVRAIFSVRPE